MLRWATHGLARVQHVLHASGRRTLTFEELCASYPSLTRGTAKARVQSMYGEIKQNPCTGGNTPWLQGP